MNPELGKVVGIEEIEDYRRYREEKPVIGESLRGYVIHRAKLNKPVDTMAVGISYDLLNCMLRGADVINFQNSNKSMAILGDVRYGIFISYNFL